MFGLVGDFASNPNSYVTPDEHRYVLQGVHGLTDFTYKIDTIDEIRKDAVDYYILLRTIYYQNQEANIRN